MLIKLNKPNEHGGEVSTFEPQETIKIWLTISKLRSCLVYAKDLHNLC